MNESKDASPLPAQEMSEVKNAYPHPAREMNEVKYAYPYPAPGNYQAPSVMAPPQYAARPSTQMRGGTAESIIKCLSCCWLKEFICDACCDG